ncbi:MAG: hypothetical protein AAB375_03655, partial [Patescibacteria group bacterium]
MRITQSGNIGIGATSPTSALHIVGDTATLLNVASGSSSRFAVLENGDIGIGSTTPEQKLAVAGNILASASGNVDLILNSTTSDDTKFTLRSTGASDRFEILGSASQNYLTILKGGNIGIGTTGPLAGLQITRDYVDSLNMNLRMAGNIPGLSFDNIQGTSRNFAILNQYFGPAQLNFNYSSAFGGNPTLVAMTIDGTNGNVLMNGNVGIGDTTPDAKLDVAGSGIFDNELIVTDALQVGGAASAAYSRFGTSATTHSSAITASNDLLISGDLEVDGSAYFDGTVNFGTIASAASFYAQDGTAALPSYTFSQDTNTGLYRVTTDTLGFTTAGTERLRFDASGNATFSGTGSHSAAGEWNFDSNTLVIDAGTNNVGIGTTSPLAKLSISGGNIFLDHTQSIRGGIGAATYGDIEFYSGSTGDMTLTPYINYDLRIVTGGIERFRVDNGGNVGIGTAAPVQKLDVAGSVNISKGSYYRYNDVLFAMASTSLYNYFTGGAGNLTMTGGYNTANGYQALYSNTTGYKNTANGFQALNANTVGIYNTANGAYALYANTTGTQNTANGYAALYSNTTGYYNTANGYAA